MAIGIRLGRREVTSPEMRARFLQAGGFLILEAFADAIPVPEISALGGAHRLEAADSEETHRAFLTARMAEG